MRSKYVSYHIMAGHPIVNDPLYASRVWERCKGPIPNEVFEKAACMLAAIMFAPPVPPIRVDDLGHEIMSVIDSAPVNDIPILEDAASYKRTSEDNNDTATNNSKRLHCDAINADDEDAMVCRMCFCLKMCIWV